MRIAIWHNLPSGGGKRALYDQVNGLLDKGHTIEIWCPQTADQRMLPLDQLAVEHVVPLARANRSALDRALRLPLSIDHDLAAMERHCQQCASEIARGGFDLLLAHSCMFFRATPIGRFVAIPTVLYQQEPFRWLYEAMPRLPWIAPEKSKLSRLNPRRLRAWILNSRLLHNARVQARAELESARAFHRILVNSLFSRESLLRAYGLDCEVCYLGTDLSRFANQDFPRERFVVGLGAYTPEKNLELVITALALLPPPRPTLVWIGNISYPGHREQMISLANTLEVPIDARLGISDAEVTSLLSRCSALVYAPRLEPFGLAPIEASACRTPVIAVAEGGVRETVVDGVNGILIPNDAQSMADAIARVLDDESLARRLGQGGRELVETFWSLEAASNRLERALCEVARRS